MTLTDEELRNIHHLDQFGLFCDYDEFEQIARAVIEANNTRVLADLRPVGGCVMENGNAVDCYAGDQVSALIQRNAELEGIRKEVVGCFDAADAEGMWEEVSASSDHLKDLYQRRILHARYAAEKITS